MTVERSVVTAGPRPSVALSCVLALLLACDASVAMAQPEPTFSVLVENRATTPIQDLYIKKSGSPEWGKNAIDGSIAAGGTRHLTLEHNSSCRYDIRVVFQDGRADEMSDVDLCQGLAVIDKPGEGGTPDSGSTSGFSGPMQRFLKR